MGLHEGVSAVSEGEARALLERLREQAGDVLEAAGAWHETLVRIHGKRAWGVLGYRSWAEFVRVELRRDRSEAQRMLTKGQVLGQLHGLGIAAPVSSVSARAAKRLLEAGPAAVAEVARQVRDEGASVREAVGQVAKAPEWADPSTRPKPPRPGHSTSPEPAGLARGARNKVIDAKSREVRQIPPDAIRATPSKDIVSLVSLGPEALLEMLLTGERNLRRLDEEVAELHRQRLRMVAALQACAYRERANGQWVLPSGEALWDAVTETLEADGVPYVRRDRLVQLSQEARRQGLVTE